MKKINILETTLRDGSYATNFSFTAADTATICQQLEEAGFQYIEIGHGAGLNASNAGKGLAAQTDEEYMEAAKSVLKKAKYGMFCIPGIARLEDLDLAKKHGMGFVRIGTNATDVRESEEFIKKAKANGMFVAANYMKSYAISPEEFAECVKLSEKWGADMVYIVDSAGGMFREDILKYYQAVRKVSNIAIGFHGHDNLGLAVSNSLEAAKMGINFIDSSLQGLGRSSGNAVTEILVAVLAKQGYDTNIDLFKVFEMGQNYIQALLPTKGRLPLDIVSGYAEFHSSYMPFIQKYSAKYQIDPAILIIEICKIDKVNLDEKVLDAVARKIKKAQNIYFGNYGFHKYIGGEQDGK